MIQQMQAEGHECCDHCGREFLPGQTILKLKDKLFCDRTHGFQFIEAAGRSNLCQLPVVHRDFKAVQAGS